MGANGRCLGLLASVGGSGLGVTDCFNGSKGEVVDSLKVATGSGVVLLDGICVCCDEDVVVWIFGNFSIKAGVFLVLGFAKGPLGRCSDGLKGLGDSEVDLTVDAEVLDNGGGVTLNRVNGVVLDDLNGFVLLTDGLVVTLLAGAGLDLTKGVVVLGSDVVLDLGLEDLLVSVAVVDCVVTVGFCLVDGVTLNLVKGVVLDRGNEVVVDTDDGLVLGCDDGVVVSNDLATVDGSDVLDVFGNVVVGFVEGFGED